MVVCCFIVSIECANCFYISWAMAVFLITAILLAVSGVTGSAAAGYPFLIIFFMLLVGIPFSLLSSIFVPPFVLGWIRKKRLRRLRRLRR